MALLSRELQWTERCVEANHRESPLGRRRRVTAVRVAVRVLAGSNLRFGTGTSLSGDGTWGGNFEIAKRGRGRRRRVGVCCAAQKSLYETLGVAPTATEKEIKRAYRGLALKFHPDVNKQPGAQEKFLEIKNAYQTLVDSKSRSKYDAGSRSTRSGDWDPFQWGASSGRKPSTQQKEEFYGIGEFWKDLQGSVDEFFKDLQSDLQKRSSARSAKPKSLWEELADIGEEFVEFLEKELNISDDDGERGNKTTHRSAQSQSRDTKEQSSKPKSSSTTGTQAPRREEPTDAKVENDVDEIEDMLAKLKKEMGR